MAVLPNGLETAGYNTSGWSAIYDANFEKLDEAVGGPLAADKGLGSDPVADTTPPTSASLTDSSGGTPSQTIGAVSGSGADAQINDNFASLADESNRHTAEIQGLGAKIDELLAAIRKTGGCGVLADNP